MAYITLYIEENYGISYLFHEKNCSKMIPKDGYAQNLRKRCRRLGYVPTNNHAFRMAFNSRLIELGFSASDRALILEHEVQTKEAHYSLLSFL